ncbi:hypothetical protein JFV28_29155 [Pseudomonas sp. TH05]|uniref:glycosyltransferase family 10 domain-containing protein n=1 Tax=unclassified Pseudomonas TaxID=196821 RepID=UPI001913B37B|nr:MULTISPECIES: glycosyltransferase family 10 [unclassified Pseudomonas]MBK5537016.1 hypothetical protein [Pseudomonas sp. TH07]MBK5559889.1 hypothetical protein [Pseudomonas sp. TH05]
MKQASFVVEKLYQNNKIFDLTNDSLNRDNYLHCFSSLKKELSLHGYNLETSDINTPENSDIVIYAEMPAKLPNKRRDISYLLLFESEVIRADNWDSKKHNHFNKIFTWNDSFIDNIRYFKFNFSHLFPNTISKDLTKKNKLCTLIAGNKKVNHPLELYSERLNAISWFESNKPNQFDFYGIGWDRYYFYGPKLIRALNRIKPLSRWLAPNHLSYRGVVSQKKETLEKYKFAICYENARDIPGYITEKIFDCFFAGCIPIYWGADNISDHIPANCFIDKRLYSSYEELYDVINNMPDEIFLEYLENIENFLNSKKSKKFHSDYFGKVISEIIINDR